MLSITYNLDKILRAKYIERVFNGSFISIIPIYYYDIYLWFFIIKSNNNFFLLNGNTKNNKAWILFTDYI